jgi:hypothetical protein
MVMVASDVFGICMSEKPLRLVVQEPDVVIHELGFKDRHVEIVKELCLDIKSLATRLLPTSKVPHSSKGRQSKLEQFAVDLLLAAHVCILTM